MSTRISQKSKYSFRFYTTTFENADFGRYGHIHLRIVLVLEGSLEMSIGDERYEIPAGSGAFIPSLQPHSFTSRLSNTFRIIELSREYLDNVFAFAKGMTVSSHVFKYSAAVRQNVLEYASFSGFCEDEARICAIIAPLAYEIREQCEMRPSVADTSMLLRILGYVEERFSEKVDLASVGTALGLHPVSVSRIIAKSTGGTFNSYLRHVRCAYAANQINLGDMTFSEIAYASGFGSIRSFNRAFLSVYSMTPSEYRDSLIRRRSDSTKGVK